MTTFLKMPNDLAAILCTIPMLAACNGATSSKEPNTPMAAVSTVDAKTHALATKLDAIATETLTKAPMLGMQVLVLQHGQVVLEGAYGHRRIDKKAKVDQDTRFAIGSITKQLTAVAVLALVDQGKVRLDDPVSKFIPSIPFPITIAELLRQTAGLPDFAHSENLDKDRAGVLAAIASSKLDFDPGTKWAYSNSNYFLLGQVIESASGRDYVAFLAERFFSPLGMHASGVCRDGDASFAQGSHADGDTIGDGDAVPPGFYFAAGMLCSTAHDLSLFQAALFGGKLLSPASFDFMTTGATLPDGSTTDYGAGVVLGHVAHHRSFWHNGAVPSGFQSEMAFYPDDGIEIIALANTLTEPPAVTMSKLDASLAKAVLGIADAPAPSTEAPLPADASTRFTGHFALGPVTCEIVVRDGKVHSLVNGKKDLVLVYRGNDRFIVEGEPERRLSIRREGWACRRDRALRRRDVDWSSRARPAEVAQRESKRARVTP